MGIVLFFTMLIPPVTANAQTPAAAFHGTPTSGNIPLTVAFTDQSTGSPNGRVWYFGDETYLAPWTQQTESARWSARSRHSSVILPDGSIVLMGGYNGVTRNNGTWRSTDNGATWTRLNASSGWSVRTGHTSVALADGSIVLMGGFDGVHRNDTWQSKNNGTTWTQLNASSGWLARAGHSSVAMPDDSIVLMGGYDGVNRNNDTWRSTDNGATWTQMNASSGWLARTLHSSVTMPDSSIVLMGGYDGVTRNNDTWRSTDNGATWTQVNASSGWSIRHSHSSVVLPDASIVLMGGWADEFRNDTWRSMNNGVTWTQLNASSGWLARDSHSSVAMPDGSIVLMGGEDGGYLNDTWRFMPAGSSEQNPSHTYTTPGIYTVALQVYNAGGYNSTIKSGYINVTNATASKIGVFRPSTHLFYLDYNGNGVWNGGITDRQYNFGIAEDLPAGGDWNLDGRTEIGVFRNSTHLFYLDYNGNGVWNGASVDRQHNFGITGDIPRPGDWNADGRTEIGVYRPSTHMFYLDYNGNGAWNGAAVDRSYNFGITGDIPIPGDWNADGRTEIGVYRPSTHLFYLDYNGNGVWDGGVTDRQYNFGLSGDIPRPGDWNADGRTEIGVFRNATHLFYLDYNGNGAWNGASIDRSYNFGISGDKPIAGKW
jgi:PKD repeat protein